MLFVKKLVCLFFIVFMLLQFLLYLLMKIKMIYFMVFLQADILALSTSEESGLLFIETAELDG